MAISIEKIMESTIGEVSSEIRASYKKTVLVRQYETEVIELDTVLKVEKTLTGAERMLISALLQAQLEYMAYCQLAFKGLITNTELQSRKSELEEGVDAIKGKAEAVLGRSLDDMININMN